MDELPELDEIYTANPYPKAKVTAASDAVTPQSKPAESPAASVAVVSNSSEDPASWTPRSLYSAPPVAPSRTKRRRTNDSDRTSFHSVDQSPSATSYHERTQSFTGSVRTEDAIDSLLRAADFSDHPFVEVQPETPGVWPHASVQEACLMRYFIDELACWVSSLSTLAYFYLLNQFRSCRIE